MGRLCERQRSRITMLALSYTDHGVIVFSDGMTANTELTRRRRRTRDLFTFMWHLGALPGVIVFASLLLTGRPLWWVADGGWLLAFVYVLFYTVSAYATVYMRRYPHFSSGKVILFLSAVACVLAVGIAGIMSAEPANSIPFVLILFACQFGSLFGWNLLMRRFRHRRYAYIPGGIIGELVELREASFALVPLSAPQTAALPAEFDGVVFDSLHKHSPDWVRFLVSCRLNDVPVLQAEEVYEQATGRVSLTHLSDGILRGFSTNGVYSVIKRAFDILSVLVVVPVAVIIMPALALFVRVESKGAAFYHQARIGQGGRPFVLHKYRSMYDGADGITPPSHSTEDKRVTRIGKMMRGFRLDELPQFFNILKGEMSLVGPRPEQVELAREYGRSIPYYSYRHIVKPGLTGWAQVLYGYSQGTEQAQRKLEYDLYYVKQMSFWFDVFIVIKTIKTVVTRFGAR